MEADPVLGGGPERPASSFPEHPAQYPMTPQKWREKENRRLKIALAVETALLVFGFLLLVLLLISLAGAHLAAPSGRIRRELVRPGDPVAQVAVVPVSGMLFSGGGGPGGRIGSAEWVVEALEAATDDPAVRAIVLEVDSPGGSTTAADVIHRSVERARADGRKVVALLGQIAASGGYYVSAPADRIVAHPTSLTGSIGVILQTFQVRGLFEKIGVDAVAVKSGNLKDMGSPFRELSEEERKILQAIADEAHARFVEVVARGRGMGMGEVGQLADGRVLTASQAKQAGLVDQLGYFEDAVELAEGLAEISGARVVRYGPPSSILSLLAMSAAAPTQRSRLSRGLADCLPEYLAGHLPVAGYLWQGGAPVPAPAR